MKTVHQVNAVIWEKLLYHIILELNKYKLIIKITFNIPVSATGVT
jgi:hypothetical protein